MKRILFYIFALFLFTNLYGLSLGIKKCKTCAKPLSQCEYKGKHPVRKVESGNAHSVEGETRRTESNNTQSLSNEICGVCGLSINQCPYEGIHPQNENVHNPANNRSCYVSFGCIATEASLNIDGIDYGSINTKVNLRYGKHKIKVKAQGYYPLEKTITVDQNNYYFYLSLSRNQSESLPAQPSTQNRNTIVVNGSVIERNGNPRYGIVVHAKQSKKSAVADKQGRFTLEDVVPGEILEIIADDKKYTAKAQNQVSFVIDNSSSSNKKEAENISRVSGQVLDNHLNPQIGASVTVSGTKMGTVTDIDGNFVLSNVPNDASIVVSFVGFKKKTVHVQPSMRIILTE